MPSSGSRRWAVDTSVAVAYLDASHSAHHDCVAALASRAAGRVLLTRDHRARQTYDLLGVPYQLLP